MIRELLAHNDYVRMLNALERQPMRFGRLQDELKLHLPQVTRALKFLADTATGPHFCPGPQSAENSAR